MNDLLDRLERLFLRMTAAHGLPGLNPPATEAQIAALESVIGQCLPDDLRAAYLRFNGQVKNEQRGRGWSLFPSSYYWPSLDEVLADWEYANASHDAGAEEQAASIAVEYDLPALGFFPSRRRILVATGCTTDFLFCDLHPGPKGKVGQIINQSAEAADEPDVWADSFAQLLTIVLDAAEQGRIQFDPVKGSWLKDGATFYSVQDLKE